MGSFAMKKSEKRRIKILYLLKVLENNSFHDKIFVFAVLILSG